MELDELLKTESAELKHGTFNDAVVVHGKWVARFPRTAASLADAPRRAEALGRIAALGLPFATPEIVENHLDLPLGRAHVITTYLPGEPSDTASDDAVRTVLDALAEVEVADFADLLDEPLHHAGGRWVAETVAEHVFPLLSKEERRQAAEVLARHEALPAQNGFVHGDLAPVNLRWHNGRITGILDWDFACAGDPALDAAAFASYGWPLVQRIRPEAYERARTHAAMFPLTGAASALLQGADPARFIDWFRRRCLAGGHPPP